MKKPVEEEEEEEEGQNPGARPETRRRKAGFRSLSGPAEMITADLTLQIISLYIFSTYNP